MDLTEKFKEIDRLCQKFINFASQEEKATAEIDDVKKEIKNSLNEIFDSKKVLKELDNLFHESIRLHAQGHQPKLGSYSATALFALKKKFDLTEEFKEIDSYFQKANNCYMQDQNAEAHGYNLQGLCLLKEKFDNSSGKDPLGKYRIMMHFFISLVDGSFKFRNYSKEVMHAIINLFNDDNLPQVYFYSIAEYYFYTNNVRDNYAKSIEWYSKISNKLEDRIIYIDAQMRLCFMYRDGRVVKQNYEEAISCCNNVIEAIGSDKNSYQQYYCEAIYSLGIIYKDMGDKEQREENNTQIKENYKRSFDRFVSLNKQSYFFVENYMQLADIHFSEKYSMQDFKKAYDYILKAQEIKPEYPNISAYIQKCLNKINNKKDHVFKDIKDLPCDSVSELIQEINEIKKMHPNRTVLYRGHADKSWLLEPTIHRFASEKNMPDISFLKDSLKTNFELNYSRCFDEKLEIKSDFDLLTKMQHYGIPTDLLDWSHDPLVALYFALTAGDDFSKTPVTDTCVWVAVCNLEASPDRSKDIQDKIYFATTPRSNKRMQAQSGVLSYIGNQGYNIKCMTHVINQSQNEHIHLYRLCLENDFLGEKNEQHKEDLKTLGKTPLSIYPDPKGLRQEVISCSRSIVDNKLS